MKKTLQFLLIITAVLLSGMLYSQNNCLEFDGTDDYINCGNIGFGGTGATLEGWVYVDNFLGNASNINTLFGREWDNANLLLRLGDGGSLSNHQVQFLICTATNCYSLASASALETDTWYHIAGVFDASAGMKIYINGVLDASLSTAGNLNSTSSQNFIIGSYNDGTARYFDGFMDEIRVWNDARTETEIRQNMYRELPNPSGEANLAAYYKLNETSGTTADDAKGSNDGTLTNYGSQSGYWQTSPAMFGPKNCLEFDGLNDYVRVGTEASPDFTPGTISFWIKPKATPTNHARVFSDDWDDDEIYLFSGAGNVATWHMINGDELISSSPLPNGKWTHVAITLDNTSSKLYINGILDDESGPADVLIENIFEIGGYSTSGNLEVVNGYLDEFRIWSDVRTESEIREYMYKNLTGNEDGLIAYYSFDNASGTVLQDISGNGHDGTLTNMTNDDWVSSSPFNIWLNTASSSWATTTNWSRGIVPTSSDNVGVYSYSGGTNPSLTGNLSVQNLFLGEGSNFNLSGNLSTAANTFLYSPLSFTSGQTVTINGNLFIDDAAKTANLNLASGASMITEGSVEGSADIDMDITSGTWHLISAPVSGIQSGMFEGNYLQLWNESSHLWEDITVLDYDLDALSGFNLWHDAKANTTFTFSGTPFTGEQSISLSYNTSAGTNDGANLVGNPYPSYIDWDQVSGYGSKYTWDGSAYKAYTQTGSYGAGSRYVAPMEGFFVVTNSTGNTFTLTNAMRTHNSAKKEASALTNGIVLSANSENYSDALYIVFDQSANENFELPRDAWKFISGTAGISQLWSKCPDGNLAVDVRPATETIQLGFTNNEAGTYVIGIKEIADISTAILEDTKLNIFHKLSDGDYSFDWSLNDDETRFKLHLNTTAVEDLSSSDVQAYVAGSNIIIQSEMQTEHITLTDITGRTLGVWDNTESIPAPATAGVYLVTVASENQIVTKKIIIE